MAGEIDFSTLVPLTAKDIPVVPGHEDIPTNPPELIKPPAAPIEMDFASLIPAGGMFKPDDPEALALAADLPELIASPGVVAGAAEDAGSMAAITAGAFLTNEPQRLKSILQKHAPGITFREDDAGSIVAIGPNGKEYSLNREGLSAQDIIPFATEMITDIFGPGKIAKIGGVAKTAAGVAADVATDLLRQLTVQEVGGGDISASQALLTGTLSTVFRSGSGFASGVGKDVVPDAAAVEEASERFGVTVMTSDINPPKSGFGVFMQTLRESVPFIGTGGKRQVQTEEAEQAIQQLKNEYGLVFEQDALAEEVIASLAGKKKTLLLKAAQLRDAALKDMDPDVPVDVRDTLVDIMNLEQSELALRDLADPGTLQILQDIKHTLSPEGALDTVSIDLAIQARTRLIQKIEALSTQSKGQTPGNSLIQLKKLQGVKKSMDDVIEGHIEKLQGPEALKKWKAGNKQFAEVYQDTRKTELRRMLNTGDYRPEVILPSIKRGDRSEMLRLHKNLGPRGKGAVRQIVIQDAIKAAGGFGGDFSADAFAKTIRNYDPSIKVFFPKHEQDAIEGLARLFELSSQARKTQSRGPALLNARGAISVVSSLGSLFLVSAAGAKGALPAAGFAVYANVLESAVVKKSLIGLSKAREGSPRWLYHLKTLDIAVRSAQQSAIRLNIERDLEEK